MLSEVTGLVFTAPQNRADAVICQGAAASGSPLKSSWCSESFLDLVAAFLLMLPSTECQECLGDQVRAAAPAADAALVELLELWAARGRGHTGNSPEPVGTSAWADCVMAHQRRKARDALLLAVSSGRDP